MNKKDISYAIQSIHPKYIQEAGNISTKKYSTLKKTSPIKKTLVLAASFAIFFLLLIPATNVQAIYYFMYSISPELTQALKPVRRSCEDQGIRMEVISASIYENEAEIYISMQDLIGERIDETMDLFDSYQINHPFYSIASCNKIDYNPQTHMVTFLIHFTQLDGGKIEGDKVTFSVSSFLSHKQEYHATLPIDLSMASLTPQIQTEVQLRGMSGNFTEQLESGPYLTPLSENIYEPISGVSITAIGFIDEKLWIQTYYTNILETDNHGYLTLKDSDGNQLSCSASVSFWDEERCGSYKEEIFSISADELNNYTLYGDFWTCNSLTEGNWQVTFPLESGTFIEE